MYISAVGWGNDCTQFKLSHKPVVAGLKCRGQLHFTLLCIHASFTMFVQCVLACFFTIAPFEVTKRQDAHPIKALSYTMTDILPILLTDICFLCLFCSPVWTVNCVAVTKSVEILFNCIMEPPSHSALRNVFILYKYLLHPVFQVPCCGKFLG